MKINIKNNEIQWNDIVGKDLLCKNTRVVCSAFSEDKLYINEWIGNDLTGITSVISTIDTDKCLAHLKIFGYSISFEEVFNYSLTTIQKAHGLVLAGFNEIIKVENNYLVDNIFTQTFLLENELNHLLKHNIKNLKISEII